MTFLSFHRLNFYARWFDLLCILVQSDIIVVMALQPAVLTADGYRGPLFVLIRFSPVVVMNAVPISYPTNFLVTVLGSSSWHSCFVILDLQDMW